MVRRGAEGDFGTPWGSEPVQFSASSSKKIPARGFFGALCGVKCKKNNPKGLFWSVFEELF